MAARREVGWGSTSGSCLRNGISSLSSIFGCVIFPSFLGGQEQGELHTLGGFESLRPALTHTSLVLTLYIIAFVLMREATTGL